ncbi:MAG: DUF4440 domain-containing protein [Burkholderiaceae bacterium]
MMITVFRSRLRPGSGDEYLRWSERMSDIAQAMPGHVAHKGYVAEDGERVTIVEFASEQTQRAWARRPEHLEAQRKGRTDFYSEYRIQVCTVQRDHRFPPRQDDLQALTDLNDQYIRSVRTADVRWFEDKLADDFLNSNPDGSIVDRAGFLAQIARPFTLANFGIEDVRIRLLGDTAIIHARTVYEQADGRRGAGRYTDTWSRRGDRWLCVSAHVTRG